MRSILVLFLVMLSLLTPFFFKKEFKLPPIHENIPPFNPDWEIARPNAHVQSILQQKFSYFSSGNQSTVFLSEDGLYVLKLFRYTRSRFNLIHQIKNAFKKAPKMDLMTKITKTLNAAHLGCTEAKEFTKAIYAHLNLTKDELPIIELNFNNKMYHLPMDRYRFILQKKVTLFKEALTERRSKPEQLEKYMLSFANLLLERSSLNILNSDPNLGPNYGFLDGQAVEIDFGNYYEISPNQTLRLEEYENLMNRFEGWVRKNMPEHLRLLKSLRLKVLSSYDPER